MADSAEGTTISWRELLTETIGRLSSTDDAEVSARRIVEEASGHEGVELTLKGDEPATKRCVAHLDAMVERRLAGEPLQYVVGRWGFRSLDLMVDARVLIPRPETEEVAGWAIDEARRFSTPVVVDLGTGSGAIGLSMVTEIQDAVVHLADVSEDAVSVARANLVGTGRAAARAMVHQGSWFEALPADLRGSVHVIVSNPPYVSAGDHLPPVVNDWEPQIALRSGPSGLDDLMPLVMAATEWLLPGGVLVLEMAPDQTETIATHCLACGFVSAEIRSDLSGRPRAVVARTATQ